ncbi:integral membrane protein GPR137 isoform X2 [Lampris incognitus]|uniref:integral membrane protein GPR137 isoform X2 n=1 Tax=Lampris incognitus TaxID=2546036 RepID=UPI0024B56AB4|nr:integral membrane protein GPR137 isoform X2 [Lampris incognitus]
MESPVTPAIPSNSTVPSPPPLHPAVAPSVQLGFTIICTALYASLFLVVYVQLWLFFCYRHKRCSYQSVFLFLCLFWAALRTTLFSFYFQNALAANHLPLPAYWLLYCFPVCLQFFTFGLINLYFTQVLLKVREMYSSQVDRGLWLARCMYGMLSAVFLCVNVVCAALGKAGDGRSPSLTWKLVLVRVLVNDLLFILEALCLAALLLHLTRHSRSTSPYLNSKGTTVWRSAALGAAVILLFSSRACYNLAVLFLSQSQRMESFDFDWYNISDQADLQSQLGDRGYLAFGAILFIWEVLPTSLLILIFRVRRPAQEVNNMANNRIVPRPYFFDDPQASDEDSAPPWAHRTPPHSSWYGAETTPLLFASNLPDQSGQHHSLYSTPQN